MVVDKKEHIMTHAIQLFADKGFEATSIRDLAKAADVNVAMVNYYFGSKEKLIEAIVEEKAAYMKDRIEELEADKTMSEIDKVNALIEDYVNRITSSPNFHKLLYKELMGNTRENLHQFITTSFTRNTKNFASIIEIFILFFNDKPSIPIDGNISFIILSFPSIFSLQLVWVG